MAEYIELDRVLKTLDDFQNLGEPSEKKPLLFAAMAIRLSNITAADVRPERHGNWVKESKMMGAFQRNLCICNICGCWYDEDGCEEAFKYCLKCGAKMDGVKTQSGEDTKNTARKAEH